MLHFKQIIIMIMARGGSRIFSRGGGGGGSPIKISICIGAKGAFRKILGSVSQKWISQNSTKQTLGRHGVESLREEKRPPPNPLLIMALPIQSNLNAAIVFFLFVKMIRQNDT